MRQPFVLMRAGLTLSLNSLGHRVQTNNPMPILMPNHSLRHHHPRLRPLPHQLQLRSSTPTPRLQHMATNLLEMPSPHRQLATSHHHIHLHMEPLPLLFRPHPRKFVRGISMHQFIRITQQGSPHCLPRVRVLLPRKILTSYGPKG